MKIAFIGDVHGKIPEYASLLAELGDTPSLQLGDMGAGFITVPTQAEHHQFIRGNHDNPAIAKAHPNYAGEFGRFKNFPIFFVGGAWSIDWEWRQSAMAQFTNQPAIWWPDEELSPEQLEDAYTQYQQVRPPVVVTHECPSSVTDLMFEPLAPGSPYYTAKLQCGHSRTAKMLQKMFEFHPPQLWVFGHYHLDKELDVNGTKFVCLAELSTMELELEVADEVLAA